MSDKYYLNDCNTQGYHCCSNSYSMTNTNRSYEDKTSVKVTVKTSTKSKWWQRLWGRDAQHAQS